MLTVYKLTVVDTAALIQAWLGFHPGVDAAASSSSRRPRWPRNWPRSGTILLAPRLVSRRSLHPCCCVVFVSIHHSFPWISRVCDAFGSGCGNMMNWTQFRCCRAHGLYEQNLYYPFCGYPANCWCFVFWGVGGGEEL